MAKDGKEYVAFIADRFVRYIETPAEERRRQREDARSRREPFLARWFGWALYGWLMQRRVRQTKTGSGAADETTAKSAADS